MKLFRRGPSRLERELSEADRETALGRLAEALAQPETPRLLCYSPNGGFAHDDTGGAVPRPACHGGAKRYVRAVSPEQEKHAAALRPCPHCGRLRDSGEGRAAS